MQVLRFLIALLPLSAFASPALNKRAGSIVAHQYIILFKDNLVEDASMSSIILLNTAMFII